jgi:cold shock CspA family protein
MSKIKWFEDEKGNGYIEYLEDRILIHVLSNGKIIDVEIKN